MNKTILGILAILCLSITAFAFEMPKSDVVPVTLTGIGKVPINVDGMLGEIVIMGQSGEQATPIVNTNVNKYINGDCQSAKIWAFDNAIDLQDNNWYKLNYQTCQIQQKYEARVLHNCGNHRHKKVWFGAGNSTVVNEFPQCLHTISEWRNIDLNAPVLN